MDQTLIKSTFGAEFEEIVTKMPVNQVSDVIESKLGFHIVKVTGSRDTTPFSEVKEQIREILEKRRKENEAKNYYDENKESEYSNDEVHARHILVKVEPDDSKDVKEEKRQKLEGILKKAREEKNFL